MIALVIFGPRRLPELGSSLGKSIRGFGKGLKGDGEDGSEEPVRVAAAPAQPRTVEPERIVSPPAQPKP